MRYFVLILILVIAQFSFSQGDTLRGESKTVDVSIKKAANSNSILQSFDKERIERLNVNSLGDILKQGVGIQIKDYGGIGGLQNISVRSIGANHTGILRNGLLMSNGSSGQVNVGLIPAYFIDEVNLNIGQAEDDLLPALAYRSANIVSIKTSSLERDTSFFSGGLHLSYGSFGTVNAGLSLKSSFKKGFVSVQSNILSSQGNFPYIIPNSGDNQVYERSNSEIFRYQFEAVTGFETKIGKTRVSYERNYTNQELPGAVVLFVFNNQQYLKQSNDAFNLQHKYSNKNLSIGGQVTYSYQSTNYTDSIVFNSQGYIDDKYYYSNLLTSLSIKYRIKKRYVLFSSIDYARNWLSSSKATLNNPTRDQLLWVLGTQIYFPKIRAKLEGNILLQGIKDMRNSNAVNAVIKANPYVGFGFFPSKKIDLRIRMFYKNNVRLPSFSEMYYSQIGNTDLEPEEAHQMNLGLTYYLKEKAWMKEMMLRVDVFQNFVTDKIVAIPTKDLFVWSILNVDKVSIAGLDLAASVKFRLAAKTSLTLAGSYSFQNALNRTDKEHVTYNHQVAYIPKHAANSSLGIDVYGASIYWLSYFTGDRFHLNENNLFNKLESFWYSDLTLGYRIRLNNKHQLQINFVIGNIADVQYEVVRSFPMVGRNYNIKISYAIN